MMGSLDAVDVGLGWIEFPWMNVEGIAPLLLENPAYTHLEDRIRDQPEIAASSPRQVLVHHGEAREHHLIETLLQFKDRLVLHLQVGELSVTIVGHRWKKAGVVSKTMLHQRVDGPVRDREAGSAIAQHLFSRDGFEDRLGPLEIFVKLLAIHSIDELVPIAMAGDLMPLRLDRFDEMRKFFGDPAQQEERGLGLIPGENLEDQVRVLLHAKLAAVPALSRNGAAEVFHLEPVLDIDGHHRRGSERFHRILNPFALNRLTSSRVGNLL